MLKKMLLLVAVLGVFAGSAMQVAVRDLPVPPCYPCDGK